MKRPKTSNKKISWFGIASVFLLAVALAVGVTSSAQAATGSFDRDKYLPSLSDTENYDRAWITVTDSSGNSTNSPDTITVSIKAGSNSAAFTLKETGGTTTVFTTTGTTQPATAPVGTTSGYVEEFSGGSHNYPALGTSVIGLNLKELTANTAGNADTSTNGELTVSAGNTLELIYSGATLDTAPIGFTSGSFSFTPSSVSAVDTSSLSSPNIIISLTDPDENLNPVMKDVIGLADSSVLLSGNPGTGSSRVQVEAIDQTTGSRLTVGGTAILGKPIMLVETGANTGIFSASGKIAGSSTLNANSNTGNVLVGSSSTSVYNGESITLGTPGHPSLPFVTFKIIEASASGSLAYIYTGTVAVGHTKYGTVAVAYKADSTPRDSDLATNFTSYGTSSLSLTKVVSFGTASGASTAISGFGTPDSSANYGTSNSGLVKLIDGSNYCLIAISGFAGNTSTTGFSNTNTGGILTGGQAGSISVQIDAFQLAGPRSGDTIKVSYLDELTSGGTSGTVTGTAAYGVAGETGTLAVDSTAPDINDLVTVTVVDGNLNTSTSTKESVAQGSSLLRDLGTTTYMRGNRLSVKSYSSATNNHRVSLSFPDGFQLGTTSIRVSSTDNTYVWMIPTSQSFGTATTFGSTTFSLGTQSVSSIPLVRGSSSGADSFLASASTSSFVARLDGLDNTVEISPDGTRWITVPIVETGANSSTFVGTIGFDYMAVRLTTSTTLSVTDVISDFTGTSSITLNNNNVTYTNISSLIGTGSVIRIFDGSTQEFAEVTSAGSDVLGVTKLSQSTAYDPDKTWIQVIGNDVMTHRLDTTSGGTVLFRIGGYFGATYRIRYNDAVNSSGSYTGGDTLAVTTSNMGFTTYTGSLSTDITGTSGPDTFVVVTLVDQDLNTSTGSKQSTFEEDATTSGTGIIDFRNENGLGVPSGSSTGNFTGGRIFKNGGTAKILYASTLSSVPSSTVNQSSGGNTVDFTLTETDNNTGTFKGSFQLSSATSTTNATDILKVSNGDNVYVFYNDSPGSTAADNSSSYTVTSPISIATSLGTLSLSKDKAYITNDTGGGDAIVATVVDVDRNTSLTSTDTLATALKVTGANYSVGTDLVLDLVESGVNTGTFLATIRTGTSTSGGVGSGGGAAGSGENDGVVKAVQDGIGNVIYTDTTPAAQSATKTLTFSAFNATLDFDADSYSLDLYALITLADAEQNTSNTVAQTLLSSVFIQTSSANSTKVRMVESGLDTGTFLGSIQVASSGNTTEFSKIKAAEGDTLKITYIDATNTTGSSRTVTDTATVAAAPATPTPTPTATATPTGTATPTPTPVTVGVIAGTVVDITTTAPIAGATVSTDIGGYSATTDATGSYTIADVAAGDYTVTASATGYDSSSQPVTVVAGAIAPANFALAPTIPGTPTPTVTPTPTEVCEPESISVSPTSLSLKRKKSGEVTVTVTGEEGCLVEGETVTATINAAGKKRISISPTSSTTDSDGQATFTITAKNKTGNARVTFKAGDVKKSMTVKVRK